MTGDWKSAGEKPQTGEGTRLAVRMRGSRADGSAIEEVDGFYLNAFGMWTEDGCECFHEGENPEEEQCHNDQGCPHFGFWVDDPTGGDEEPMLPFRCVEWCKR